MLDFENPFFTPETLNHSQLLFVTMVYGLILFQGSNLISDGSEFLLLIPSLQKIIGPIVLPVLGAVPDGMMVFFSGLGPHAQQQVSVGVGALAGSTIMLLTLPWFIAVNAGKVIIEEDKQGRMMPNHKNKDPAPFFDSGVLLGPSIRTMAYLMLGTSSLYLIIQVPAIVAEGELTISKLGASKAAVEQSEFESLWSLIGCVLCAVVWCAYLYYMYKLEDGEGGGAAQDKMIAKIVEGIDNGHISINAVLRKASSMTIAGDKSLADDPYGEKEIEFLSKLVKPFFKRYDNNGDGMLNLQEFKFLLRDLNEKIDDEVEKHFQEADTDKSGSIEFEEFVKCLAMYISDPERAQKLREATDIRMTMLTNVIDEAEGEEGRDDDEDDDDDEVEMPEDIAEMPAEQQRTRILMRAFSQMGAGTLLILIFSDPAVGVLAEIGARIGVSPFYVSFLLAPMASNAAELIAAYNYASKRTSKAVTTSLETLEGAACMNNTFCLGIFMGLVYCKGIAWQFTAETLCTIAVEVLVGILVLRKETMTMFDAGLIFLCYPLTLALVWVMENKLGLD